MKLQQLRTIIREEVRAAVKEELQDILTEAVTIASSPNKVTEEKVPFKLNSKETKPMVKDKTINEMLEMTKLNLTSQDAQHFVGSGVQKPNFASSKATQLGMSGAEPGLDLSKLDFVSKAKSILDLSNKKDEQKAGLA